MPKQLENKNPRKSRKSPKKRSGKRTNTNGSSCERSTPAKRRKTQSKVDPKDEICKSKLLVSKLQSKPKRTTKVGKPSAKDEERICGNGKPMPSLAELEKMFEDSDGDEQAPANITSNIHKECLTPEKKAIEKNIPISPGSLKTLANKMLDMISNIPNVDDEQRPSVIPPKKRKKSEVPYIVGCTERVQVPWQPKSSFCKGEEKYGAEENSGDDDDQCTKRKKRGKKMNVSKSVFNAKSDEIAARLKETESSGNSSPDSNKTVAYDYSCASPRTQPRFSPLPSTSRDRDTFLKNDQRFNESLQFDKISNDSSHDDIELIEIPCETIIIDDTSMNKDINAFSYDITEDDSCFIVESNITNDNHIAKKDNIPYDEDDDVHIVDDFKRIVHNPVQVESPNNDIYSSLDLCQNYDDDICEVIDVDDVIAENKMIIEKYRKESDFDAVILVEPSLSEMPKTSIATDVVAENRVTIAKSRKNRYEIIGLDPSTSNVVEKTIANTDLEVIAKCDCVPSSNHNSLSSMRYKIRNNAKAIAAIVSNFFSNVDTDSTTDTGTLHDVSSRVPNIPLSERVTFDITDVINSPQNTMTANHDNVNFATSSRFEDNNNNTNIPTNQPTTGASRVWARTICIDDDCSLSPSTNRHPIQSRDDLSKNNGVSITTVDYRNKPHFEQRSKKNLQKKSTSLPCPELPPSPKRSIGDCPICMDTLANNTVASTLCGHVFCMSCIKAAILANGKKCPTCRKKLKGAGYHQLFL